ncbi:hypothetical protein EVAR_100241_1 [Eumeta japonica]|uniref:Uncharacterized protein n=1 Tax=Eumeta variegata TaxID=151549 RepID=A0A4C1ZTE8_EUMVA|nr:hypothetical protein EVAR_100241_1 [Eumeta japonica]
MDAQKAELISHNKTKGVITVKAVVGGTPYNYLLRQYPKTTKPAGTTINPKPSTEHYTRTTPGPQRQPVLDVQRQIVYKLQRKNLKDHGLLHYILRVRKMTGGVLAAIIEN